MKRLLTLLLFAISLQLHSQTDSTYYVTELDVDLTTIDFDGSKSKLVEFVKQNQIAVQSQNESKTTIKIKAMLTKSLYDQLNDLLPTLGYTTSRKVNTVNNNLTVNDIRLELNFLKSKKASYDEMLKKTDEKSEKYATLWNENKQTEEKIFKKEKELLPYTQKRHNYAVDIQLTDEKTSPDNSRVSFVNMPGFEYSYLTIESPSASVSSKQYQGYFLKYLFTKGKSYALVGAYKSTDKQNTDSLHYSEMFVFGFGQDFYSRHLGRGSRRFFNLYSGYSFGYILATGLKSKLNSYFLSPSIGMEIFKNKYILLDTKASYFLPLSDNKNLRGLSISTSFNFVF